MSVHEPKPLPPPATILTAIDVQARAAMEAAKVDVAALVSRETPRSSGQTAAALKPRVSRTATGTGLTVGAPRGRKHGKATVAEVMRWVNSGTGMYREGPGPKHKIRAKSPLRRMTLPGGAKRWSVKGQRPDHFMLRIRRAGTPIVERAAEQGAQRAAREIERVIG
jgi:hypothetical protein